MASNTVDMNALRWSDWVSWRGGKCPVAPHVGIELRFRGNEQTKIYNNLSTPEFLNWQHFGAAEDIVAYRVMGEPENLNTPNKPHKHCHCIIAWAKGALIEELNLAGNWEINPYPIWHDDIAYRVHENKPKKVRLAAYFTGSELRYIAEHVPVSGNWVLVPNMGMTIKVNT